MPGRVLASRCAKWFGDRIDGTMLLSESKTHKITERPVVEELLALAERMGLYLEE
ncbi:hypothetical protein ABIA51_002701 [Erwinia aphidicola]